LKVFIDTNIFLDVILEREGYNEALEILTSCYNEENIGVIADITLLNIDYIASKQIVNIREFLEIINNSFEIIGADNKIFNFALGLDNKDLEDNVQYFLAKESGCDLIVSNDKKFYRGDIKVVSAKEFTYKELNGF